VPAAPPFVLTDATGAVHCLDALTARGPVLLVFAERDCPTSVAAVRALTRCGGNVVVICEGTPAAAEDLTAAAGADALPVLVEADPYPVSAAYGLTGVPTFVLVDAGGAETGRCEGWDRAAVARLVDAAGGNGAALAAALPEVQPGCQSRNTYDGEIRAALAAADTGLVGDGVEELWRSGWHDGLPVVPPTRARVRAMLAGCDPDESLGRVPPVQGELTLERLAACAVLAGCAPAYFPVVRATAEAVLDPAFNLHGVQNTTHFAAPVVVVNGPVRTQLGMNAGSNVFGVGNRATRRSGARCASSSCSRAAASPGASTCPPSAGRTSSGSASPSARRPAHGSRCTSSWATAPRRRR
jgi:hypothetical protein